MCCLRSSIGRAWDYSLGSEAKSQGCGFESHRRRWFLVGKRIKETLNNVDYEWYFQLES